MVKSTNCKSSHVAQRPFKPPCLNAQLKPPKCYIKITGSRYNGTFLLNIDNGLDDAIYHTMRDIEVALEEQTDPMGKSRVSPKNCLSSVFRCFGTGDLQTKAVYRKKKYSKPVNKPAKCSLTATINQSDLGPLISAVQSRPVNIFPLPSAREMRGESMMRDVVDVFRTTLDTFHKDNLRPSEVPQHNPLSEVNISKHYTPTNTGDTEAINHVKPCEGPKKVAIIKFTQEEVLVIQPPKPCNDDTQVLEVGIEIKPKATASNVGQSIKLAKDKVLIGVQDGRGVLQISDVVPKRSLEMVIEQGLNGKPSMKLRLEEENSEQEKPVHIHNDGMEHQKDEREPVRKYTDRQYNGNGSVSNTTFNNKNPTIHNDVKHFKSVESQVSWTGCGNLSTLANEKRSCKSESAQYQLSESLDVSPNKRHCGCCTVRTKPQTSDVNNINECTGVSPDTIQINSSPNSSNVCQDIPETGDPCIKRMPYLVHTLYEPKSLQNSSAYLISENPSSHCSIIKKPKSFSFSSDYSSSSKRTKIFREIGEIGVNDIKNIARPALKKDVSTSASLVEDFDIILQNMCGSSYMYHHSNPQESKLKRGEKRDEKVITVKKQSSESMSFDQWTQTDSWNSEFKTDSEPLKMRYILETEPLKIRDSIDFTHSRITKKKVKRTRSSALQRFDEPSNSTLSLEDELSSDSSGNNNHKLVYSMVAAPDDPLPTPVIRTNSALTSGNLLPQAAKSYIGQRIFSAIEEHTNRQEPLISLRNSDSFVYPACKDASSVPSQNNISVVNVALCDPRVPISPDIMDEDLSPVISNNNNSLMPTLNEISKPLELEKSFHDCSLQDTPMDRPSFPIRVKSRSCQNLKSTTSDLRSMENVGIRFFNQKSRTKKLRYPHITATDSTHTSTLNMRGILNLNEASQTEGRLMRTKNPKSDQALPPAIRSLLLPRRQSSFKHFEQMPTFCWQQIGTINTDFDSGSFEQYENDWCIPNEAADVADQLAIHRCLFKRTFFAMKSVKTVVSTKFSTFIRKLSFKHSDRKKDTVMQGSAMYVAVPLKKKKGKSALASMSSTKLKINQFINE